MQAFKKCQDARKLKLERKKSVVVKQEPVTNKPVKKKQVKKTYIDLNEMSSSEEEEQEIVYVKKKKRRPRKVVKYISSSESEEEYPVLNTSQERYDCDLNDYYRFVG